MLFAVVLLVCGAISVGAVDTNIALAPLSEKQLTAIKFEQKLNQQVSLALPFIDDAGRHVTLADCLDGKPAIVVLGYYECPMLCTFVLNGLVSSLQDLKPSVGETYSVIFVSIDPHETPALAAAKKANYLKFYGRRTSAPGWHFLTGSQNSIETLAHEIGYQFAYDPLSKQFAHPSGLTILTGQGKVSRYFFGVEYPVADLDKALREAGSNKIGSPIAEFLFLCFHYNPIRSKYGAVIMTVVRASGVLTIVGMAGMVIFMRRRWS